MFGGLCSCCIFRLCLESVIFINSCSPGVVTMEALEKELKKDNSNCSFDFHEVTVRYSPQNRQRVKTSPMKRAPRLQPQDPSDAHR